MSNPLESSFKPDAPFYERVQSLRSAKTLVRALPRWCKENNTSVSLNFIATPEGVEIQLGWPEGTTEETANAALKALADTEKLMEMESIVQHLTFFGGSPEMMPEIINQLVEETEDFARKIHPEGEVLPGFDALHGGSGSVKDK